ncbi:ABC transporter ATP-binding protein [Variovorax sp. NFACC27]|uniref:ABC transporter ATP-binding protein n=1 Tax=unclassified Variovorax TaxID=663243 RepID=UPI0008978FE5|nr:branched-chain amino acid transport system ATP-binding protein [Variovorax sp. NFACC28]SEG98165.1 branched-chain amino acid transport system ATP-binding protein [Variovorax sp. NFACC29]SFE05180.1 branched-chain amino acid transport system ATP-binding protein [Variovorax sp. NFACC26]SFH13110.1 branched-chain amino acid transport system ATP-binding protein [Variovorax sp. NFACC27]
MSKPLLDVRDLSRRFGGLKAVEGLSLEVGQGEIVGLLGPNGSGKTTALNLISGALRPDRGSVKLDGLETAGAPNFKVARLGISRTYQLVRLFKTMTVLENTVAGMSFTHAHLFGREAVAPAMELLDLVGLSARASHRAEDLTYIDQKRLELARCLASRPRVLLLDEWLAGLNPTELLQAIELVRSLKHEGVSILMVEHVLEAVRSLCDYCVVMNAGQRIARGTAASVLADPEVVRAYLGDEDA